MVPSALNVDPSELTTFRKPEGTTVSTVHRCPIPTCTPLRVPTHVAEKGEKCPLLPSFRTLSETWDLRWRCGEFSWPISSVAGGSTCHAELSGEGDATVQYTLPASETLFVVLRAYRKMSRKLAVIDPAALAVHSRAVSVTRAWTGDDISYTLYKHQASGVIDGHRVPQEQVSGRTPIS